MVTHSISPASHSRYEDESCLAVRETTELKKQRVVIVSRHRLVQWYGILSTAFIGVAALAPNVFGIPPALQPWVFVAFIFWHFAFCAGMFDL
jgi:hypothetical protein